MAFLEGLDYLPNGAEEPKGSRLNLPSLAGILGIDTDNRFLNWQGIFGGEPKHKMEIDSEALENLRRHHRFMSNMTGMGFQALPFVGPIIGGMGVIKGVSPLRGRAIRKQMSAENVARGKPSGSLVGDVSRGLWLHGRGAYPKTGETFADSRVRVGNLGEPYGLSLTADKELLARSFAKHQMPKGKKILMEKETFKEYKNQWDIFMSAKGFNKDYAEAELKHILMASDNPPNVINPKVIGIGNPLSRAPSFARVFPQFGGIPEEKILPAWVAPETEWSQKIIKDAYIESLPKEIKTNLHSWLRRTDTIASFDPAVFIKHSLGEMTDLLMTENFNKRISQNLLKKGYKALMYSPERYNEYEMRMFDPADVLMLDMRKQEDPALGKMYEETLTGYTFPDRFAIRKKGTQAKKLSKWKQGAAPREGASLRNIYEKITWEDIERVLGEKSADNQLMIDLSLLVEEADTILAGSELISNK